MRSDLAEGRVPTGVRRALFAHEVTARTNFASIQDDVTSEAATITARLGESRARFVDLVVAELRRVTAVASPVAPIQRIAQRIFDADGPDGLRAIAGATDLLDEDARWVRGRLGVVGEKGFRQILREAAAQAFPVPADLELKLDLEHADHLDLAARRVAQAPQVDVIRALRERVYVIPRAFVTPDEVIRDLEVHARGLSAGPLEQYASDAAAQAHGIGRLTGAGVMPEARAYYSSELLDRNTCGPCSLVDGHRFDTYAAMRADYPYGQYRSCEGGSRCRGTPVVVWSAEAEPTLDRPGDRP